MLTTTLIHPPLLSALAAAGHGSTILIADANYPASTRRGPRSTLIHLNLRPGLINAVEVLRVVLTTVPVEQINVMAPLLEGPHAMATEPPIWADFRAALLEGSSSELSLEPLQRQVFYDTASSPDAAVTIISGEARIYGNVLLRIGVVK